MKITAEAVKKFIAVNGIDVDWRGSSLYIWMSPSDLGDFFELFGQDTFDDGGIKATLMFETVCVDLVDVLGWFGVKPTDVLSKEERE